MGLARMCSFADGGGSAHTRRATPQANTNLMGRDYKKTGMHVKCRFADRRNVPIPAPCLLKSRPDSQNFAPFLRFRNYQNRPNIAEISSEILQLLGLVAKKIEFPADVRTHGICLQTNPKGAPAFPVICQSVFLHIRLNG